MASHSWTVRRSFSIWSVGALAGVPLGVPWYVPIYVEVCVLAGVLKSVSHPACESAGQCPSGCSTV